jgi:hypothetical protein
MDSIGMGGRFAPESVDELDRNMHFEQGKAHVFHGSPLRKKPGVCAANSV